MWILALAKNLDASLVRCHLGTSNESPDQNQELYHRFQLLGLPSYQIRMRGRFDVRSIWRLANLIRRQGIDIIHTHGYKSDLLGLMAARLAGVPCLSTPHGFENAPDLKLQMFIRLGCMALRHFDMVAPLSEELWEDMGRIGVRASKVRLIVNGVDLTEVEAERRNDSPPIYPKGREKLIGYVGQIAHRKNIADMIKTFDLLYHEHKEIRLILIGEGPQRSDFEQFARSLPSAGHIDFLGYRTDRLRLVKELDLFCMTSSLEGIPRCMMEAMAMGTPVAAFQIPGIDRLIIPEKTGLMAHFGDIQGLKGCFDRILFDKPFAEELAQNGRAHILGNFSAKRMAEEYSEAYYKLAVRRSRPPAH